jgi:DnaA family protein
MHQLPLPVRLRTSSVFSSFFAGSNGDVVECLQQQQFGASPVVFLYGKPATGKTHLLQALCVYSGEQHKVASYVSAADLLSYGPELLSGLAQHTILCIDDVDELLIDKDWNRALFNLYRDAEEQHGKLIMSAKQSPAAIQFPLADLASRVLAGTILRLVPLNDAELVQALQLHASQRGLVLPEETAVYLLNRLPRDMVTLCGLLDELDIASLAAQRRLTLPFVKQVLDNAQHLS